MAFDDLRPSQAPAGRCGLDVVGGEDVLDRGPADLAEVEFAEFSNYSRIAPPGLTGGPENQNPDLPGGVPLPQRPGLAQPRLPGTPACDGAGGAHRVLTA